MMWFMPWRCSPPRVAQSRGPQGRGHKGRLTRGLGVAAALVALGCSGGRSTATGGTDTEIPAAVIDTGATLADVEPGRGIGLFVEYGAGGRWRVQVTCDTLESEFGCAWDVLVSSPGELNDITEERFEPSGGAELTEGPRGSTLRFESQTTTAVDAMRFEATPGAPLRIDVLLDGAADGRYIYWVGGGALHRGAPSPVLDLLPTSP